MKKSLVALAAFAAVSAFAQSSVTLSGIVKGGVAQTKYSGGGAGTNGNGLAIADGSSRFIIGGTEDLGGGLKAVFQIDTRFRLDESPAAAQAGGNTFVGLRGGLGMVQLGKLDTHYCLGSDQHGARSTALQASSCSILGYVNGGTNAIANASRSVNVVRYTTPNFSGFQGQANYSTNWVGSEGAVGDAGKGRAMSLGLNYSNGPLRTGVSFWDANSESRVTGAARNDQSAGSAFIDWNFGVATVGLTYDSSQINGGTIGGAAAENRRRAFSIPVTVPLGAGTFLVTYTKAQQVKLNGTTTPNTGATMFSVGYDYALSKRTSVGVSYAKINNQSAAGYNLYTQAALNGTPNNAVGQDPSQLYLGVRHAF
ncbi:MAG: porin [Polaromonas sp.]|uniref:porin n=1 Tax=Polaromonas sp. TaxID=1869339 RepID=UPI0027354D0F|nr:porin [Polaromonas sp.]MDP2819104.1 porin [Polaromonas sp.]